MGTYVLCSSEGSIYTVLRGGEPPSESDIAANVPDGGFLIDVTEEGDFDSMELIDIYENYKAGAKKDKLVKRK